MGHGTKRLGNTDLECLMEKRPLSILTPKCCTVLAGKVCKSVYLAEVNEKENATILVTAMPFPGLYIGTKTSKPYLYT